MKIVIIVVLFMLSRAWAIAESLGKQAPDAVHASITQVLANPKRYDRKLVGVCGIAKILPVVGWVFFSKDHARWNDTANSLEILPNSRILGIHSDDPRWVGFDGKAVYVEGQLSAIFIEDDTEVHGDISVTFIKTLDEGHNEKARQP